MIRFIHAADLHLDTPFKGLEQTSQKLGKKLRKAPFESIANIVDLALEKSVDFVLLAGDLYNTKQINIKAQSLFIAQLERLNQAEIPVFLIRGNHDYLTETAATLALPFPKNVHPFGPEVETIFFETKMKKRVAITGFSFDAQWVLERKIKEYPERSKNVDLQVGLLHGALETSQTKEANYAPFTLGELRDKNYDYWALGHVHQRQILSTNPPVHYPGNIQGLHKNEMGPKGCLLIEWSEFEQSVDFVETAPIIWDTLQLEITETEQVGSFLEKAKAAIVEKEYKKDVLLQLEFLVGADADNDFIRFSETKEFAEQIGQQLGFENIWIASVEHKIKAPTDQRTLAKLYPDEWGHALEELKEADVFDELTEKVFNQIPRKYLNETNTKAYREKILEQAMKKLYFN